MSNATALPNTTATGQWAPEGRITRWTPKPMGWKEDPGAGAGCRMWAGGEDPGGTADALACGGCWEKPW